MSSPILSARKARGVPQPSSKAALDFIQQRLAELLKRHAHLKANISREEMIRDALSHREAIIAQSGALATWNPAGETGRIPKDTYIVEHPDSEGSVDWSFSACIPMTPVTFDLLFNDALKVLSKKERLYVMDRVIGAAASYALPTRVVTDKALTALFADNMFRPVSDGMKESVFHQDGFTLLAIPHDKIDTSKYEGRLRSVGGSTVDMVVAMDFERKLGLVYGCSYCGSVKKLMFTVMNYLLPERGVLPLHCSANEDSKGNTALLLGLSGTGKTTLSNDPARVLIGDDEHGWSDDGIENFENGCYAKLIHLREEKEPEVYHAVFDERPHLEHGCIIENAMVYPDGSVDVDDDRFTENSRASYPLSFLTNVKESAIGGHPQTILFLTADAHGVLPPVAKLTLPQAMFWFIMGYTSKLAGTEAGVTTPVSTFSRFFGGPFMPRHPQEYASLLGKRMKEHGVDVYLINTGWTGGPYGVGERMDISVTRKMVDAVLSGALKDVEYHEDARWHVMVPMSCPGVGVSILDPKSTWKDPDAYEEAADKLADEFASFFDKAYGKSDIDPEVVRQCPGL